MFRPLLHRQTVHLCTVYGTESSQNQTLTALQVAEAKFLSNGKQVRVNMA